MKKYKENLENKDILYDKLREEKIENARKEVARRKKEKEEERKKENMKEPVKIDTDNVAHGKIEKLREILDEVDQNVYENEQKLFEQRKKDKENALVIEDVKQEEQQESTVEQVTPETQVNTETDIESNIKTELTDNLEETEKSVNNFKSENMEALEKMDPWLARKLEQEKGSTETKDDSYKTI